MPEARDRAAESGTREYNDWRAAGYKHEGRRHHHHVSIFEARRLEISGGMTAEGVELEFTLGNAAEPRWRSFLAAASAGSAAGDFRPSLFVLL